MTQGPAQALQPDNPFWTFTLAIYRAPGVSQECITLQDTLSIDVDVLLYVVWVGAAHKLVLGEQNFTAIDDYIRRWHTTVVRPLRAVRQAMKALPEMTDDTVKTLRQDVAAIELRAEQIEHALLHAALAELTAGAKSADTVEHAVRANVTAFIARAGRAATEALAAPHLIAAASNAASHQASTAE